MVKKIKALHPKVQKFISFASKCAAEKKVRIYLVGGIVRDCILRRKNIDCDIVVEGEGIDFAVFLAKKTKSALRTHHGFGTATVYLDDLKVDVATCRKEIYAHNGALPKVSASNLKDDLFRRDFTFNAMAISLNKDDYGKLIDYYNGAKDLKKKEISVLHGQSFFDDPTRILRAVRFEQRFSFKMKNKTKALLKKAVKANALSLVNEQRLRDELTLILKEDNPAKYIKRIDKLIGFSFLSKHIELTRDDFLLFSRIRSNLKKYEHKNHTEDWLIYLMALLHNLSDSEIYRILSRFCFKKRYQDHLRDLSKDIKHTRILLKKDAKLSKIYEVLKPMSHEKVVFLSSLYNKPIFNKRVRLFIDSLSGIHLKVKGQDLKKIGLKPENLYGRTLKKLMFKKIDNNILSKKDELDCAVKIFTRLKMK